MIMVPARERRRRAVLLGGSLCFVAVLAILVGGISHTGAVAHHRTPAVATSWIAGDNTGVALRVDQPVALAVGAAVVLGALILLRYWTAAPTPNRFTAHSPAPRGPPGQAR